VQAQTREHLFKVRPEWRAQLEILRAEVWKESGGRRPRSWMPGVKNFVSPHALLHDVRGRGSGWGEGDFFLFFPFCSLLGALSLTWGQAWAEGKGELAMCRHRADSGRELVGMHAAIVYMG